jgi:alcohol dehydrogenase class IV
MPTTESFRFEYDPGTLVYGHACVDDLESELASLGSNRALIVTGETVGETAAVIDPVREGIGDRLGGTFAETSPDKRLSTTLDGAERMREEDIDALVSLGGGSSLDVAKVMSAIAADERSQEAIRSEFVETGTIAVSPDELTPILAVPTTLAGADLSVVAGVTERSDELIRGGVFDGRLMPESLFYDPTLIETTPHEVLCASAMNGFDKGIESLYARNATPVTDSTASHGLSLLGNGLPRLGAGERNEETLYDSIVGTMLVQYGASRGEGTTLSLIHAFGHGIARGYAVQQGGAHAIIAPHALRFLFDRVDGRRDLLADALDVESNGDPDETAEAVVERVADIRTSLGLPTRLRSIEDMSEDDLSDIASVVHSDGFMANTPAGLDATEADLERVLREAW